MSESWHKYISLLYWLKSAFKDYIYITIEVVNNVYVFLQSFCKTFLQLMVCGSSGKNML